MLALKYLDKMMIAARDYSKATSDDAETKVGAVLINPKLFKKELVYASNTFADGNEANTLPRTRPDKNEFMVHAEVNLVAKCASQAVKTKGSIVVCTLSPCPSCLRTMFQAGIREVYFMDFHPSYKKSLRDIVITESEYYGYTYLVLSKNLEATVE